MNKARMLRPPFALFTLCLVCCSTCVFAQTVPSQTTPPEAPAAQSSPAQIAPAQALPADVPPAQTAPAQTAPAQAAPAQTAPAPQLSTRDASAQPPPPPATNFDQVIDRAIEREHFFMSQMKQLH